jgi:hypothetical protein
LSQPVCQLPGHQILKSPCSMHAPEKSNRKAVA